MKLNLVLFVVACVLLAVFATMAHASFTTHLPAPAARVWVDGAYALWLLMTAVALLGTIGSAALAVFSFRALKREMASAAPCQATRRHELTLANALATIFSPK